MVRHVDSEAKAEEPEMANERNDEPESEEEDEEEEDPRPVKHTRRRRKTGSYLKISRSKTLIRRFSTFDRKRCPLDSIGNFSKGGEDGSVARLTAS